MSTTDTPAADGPPFSLTRVFTWGDPDAPGDGFVYDGWDEALTNIGRHLAGEAVG